MLPDPSSFRDPSGFVFTLNKKVYRAIAPAGLPDFTLLHSSGLYDALVAKKMLLSHSEINDASLLPDNLSTYKVIQPEEIPFISYPYEWCFSQLKKAALLTLSIQMEAMKRGMTLKDATAFNIQFRGTQPVFIDTLSFEKYEEGKPWVAYRQFCQHFLAPLALMAWKSLSLSSLSRLYLDGIPLDLANTLLPKRALLNSTVLSHIHFHSRFKAASTTPGTEKRKTSVTLSKGKLTALLQHMEDGIRDLRIKKMQTAWVDYHEFDNYTEAAKKKKHEVIAGWMEKLKPSSTWDLGCNTGEYSLLASRHSANVLSMDYDVQCIEELYNKATAQKTFNILPLTVDLSNPTPAIGWAGAERKTIPQRGHADLLLALALVHHLRIGNNTPWNMIAKLFSEWGDNAIVEFVPREDSQIQRMLGQRKDIFNDLDDTGFKRAFGEYFDISDSSPLPDSLRVLCLLKRKKA